MSFICIFKQMKRKNTYSPYEILVEKVDDCPLRDIVFNYFQMVYIVSGNGKLWVNDNVTTYSVGDLFLLTPDDSHSFDVDITTEFFLVKFNKLYIKEGEIGRDNFLRLEHILSKSQYRIGTLVRTQSDRWLVKMIVTTIIRESVNNDLYSKDLIQQLMNSLILIAARNISTYLPEEINNTTNNKIIEILQYIQNNIYTPEKIRIEIIGKEFGLSKTYVSRYFKKHTTESIQQYIAKYRISLIENRLQYSDLRIGEIAYEFGFTDESHINNFFRKMKGINPSEYRKMKKLE